LSAHGRLQLKSMSPGMSAIKVKSGLVVLNMSFAARDRFR
jgi:hypothetical protein